MYSKEEHDVYYLDKLLLALMFDKNNNFYKNVPWFYDVEVLEKFKPLISAFVQRGYIRNNLKGNIYKILMDGRLVLDDNYKKRTQIINEIIRILNIQNPDESILYYIKELYVRTNAKKPFNKYTAYYTEDVEKQVHSIDNSIFNDFIVLFTHSKEVSDEDFKELYLPDLVNNNFYYESLNTILEECPSMFKDELFFDRFNMILKENKKINRTYSNLNKNIVKKVKRAQLKK